MNIEKELNQIEKEIEEKTPLKDKIENLKNYKGEDEIISSLEVKQDIEEERKKYLDACRYKTHIPALNKLLGGGFREGQLIVLSGYTGEGKTLLCQNFTEDFTSDKHKCLWFSYEVESIEFFERFKEDTPVFYLPKKNVEYDIQWLKERVLEAIAKYNTKIIFIDHLHYLIDIPTTIKGNSSLIIGALVREIYKLTKELKLITILIAHPKQDIDRPPTKHDIRDSGLIICEADYVMLIWRKKEKTSDSPTGYRLTNYAHLIVDKARPYDAKQGYVKLLLNKNTFEEVEELVLEDDGSVNGVNDLPF